jgi:aspartyl-tRNA(Asn)/glutamyl-tRNA(Gln) amidotransferase subunit A
MTGPAAGKAATAADIAAAVSSGGATAAAVVEAALRRIAELDKTTNAFTSVLAERARRAAAAIDAAVAVGKPVGPLAGVPFAVKNLFDIQGLATLAGSKINADLPPAARDATVIERLEAAGAILVGGLNMGEYAYDFTGRNAHAGHARNPRDPAHMTGGSSGGSGAAVAGGLVPLSLGSDTNGSIRVPASLCGVFGLKPTYGRLSRAGTFLFCDSLDHIGPMARSARDLAVAFDVMQGADPADPVCTERPAEPTLSRLDDGIAGLRLALAGDYFERQLEPVAAEAVATVARALGVTRKVTLPGAARARGCAYLITTAEGGTLHLARLRARAADYDPETRERFIAGALTPAAWYIQAQRFRRLYRQRALEALRDVDVLIAPATPVTAPAINDTTMTIAGVEMPVRANLGIFTQPISFIGLPVVAAPLQRPGGLPIAVQLIAKPFDEQAVLRVARWLEREGICAAPPA